VDLVYTGITVPHPQNHIFRWRRSELQLLKNVKMLLVSNELLLLRIPLPTHLLTKPVFLYGYTRGIWL